MHIDCLTLFTTNLEIQHAFYTGTLGLDAVGRTSQSVTFQAGRTLLTFCQHDGPETFSHFAMDIPRNQVDGAEAWLRGRVALLEDSAGISRFPLSESWNSESLYFEDAAGNIVEFIARHDLTNDSPAPFGPASVLHISELGVVVPDVTATVLELERRFGLSAFHEQSPTFSPLGGQDGLLIVVREGRGWFPVGQPARAAPFEMTFRKDGQLQRLRDIDLREQA
ncbi:VOC family protein [Deinococcus humi]|uniref:Catechol 2,3-dioxygenase-like lactoylglutathione lyase family enzyme n=1 Tax=Deinococcus humi TaxID=662880 RepID=A0A7W8JY09_9DEIO|nr:hypothetical protein [Deinococcus humi]MBB5365316.1 catechol 2,3-dioxygenase-like lactoylglutathione lyase family enzyme [Deinococcus humi]GGO36360.1 hypothetical protein GCM10008949_40130 [Deinococcus humi]